MNVIMELNAVKLSEGEHLVGVLLPTEGKMLVEDVCALLNIKSATNMRMFIRERGIAHHKVGRKMVVDLKDMWAKTLSKV